MENNKSKLEDPLYFKNLKEKMMLYADNNPKPKHISFNFKWAAAIAAILALGMIFYWSVSTQSSAINTLASHKNDSSEMSPIENIVITDVTEAATKENIANTIITSKTEAIVEELTNVTIKNIENTDLLLDDTELENNLLETITEEELDELLAQYI